MSPSNVTRRGVSSRVKITAFVFTDQGGPLTHDPRTASQRPIAGADPAETALLCFPPRGKHNQRVARLPGQAGVFVSTLLDSPSKSVRIFGTDRPIGAFVCLKGIHLGQEGLFLTLRQANPSVATREPQGSRTSNRRSIVAPSLIKNDDGPHDLGLQQAGKGANAAKVPVARFQGHRPPFQRVQVIDMAQGTRTLPPTHSTPPWCQQRVRAGWPFGGVFVLPKKPRPSTEGVGMR